MAKVGFRASPWHHGTEEQFHTIPNIQLYTKKNMRNTMGNLPSLIQASQLAFSVSTPALQGLIQ
jgi:hypothetical protein